MGRSINKKDVTHNDDGAPEIIMVNAGSSANDRIVFLSGDVNEHSISSVITQLISLANHNSQAPIHLVVSTYGGSVDEMFSLYDAIKFLPCPVYTIALGKVMSAGVLLLAAGDKGKRMIGRNARIMMHPVSGGALGNVFEILNDAKEIQRQYSSMLNAMVKETTMSREDIERVMKMGHDYFVTPSEAIKLGIVDKIIGD
jgi:ATP-dependent Clp protease, protease subunit